MDNWRGEILKDFSVNASRLSIVDDRDALFQEIRLVKELNRRGFQIIKYADSIEFRYEYERSYRPIWDSGQTLNLIVILEQTESSLTIDDLPFDILKKGRRLSYSLANIFPTLSYPILTNLPVEMLDTLYEKRELLPKDPVGDDATLDFLLRLVYQIQVESINTDVDLLSKLLQIHYYQIPIDSFSAKRLASLLKDRQEFDKWPIELLLLDSAAFYSFIEERWQIYIKHIQRDTLSEASTVGLSPKVPGPMALPFSEKPIRMVIDNLFAEGILKPVFVEAADPFIGSWARCGVVWDEKSQTKLRLTKLQSLVTENMPTSESDAKTWQKFSLLWAEFSRIIETNGQDKDREVLNEMRIEVDNLFSKWLSVYYRTLSSLSPSEPTMVHHIHRMLERKLQESSEGKVALIVIDGLSLSQWLTIRHSMEDEGTNLSFHESTVFAWIPTLTSISRQAIFAGRIPLAFSEHINTTDYEENLWAQSWQDIGTNTTINTYYQKQIEKCSIPELLSTMIQEHAPTAAGLVINIVDEIMHGEKLGARGMHTHIGIWLQQRYLEKLFQGLLDQGYSVWITSDHGNIECKGTIQVSGQGALPIENGQRVKVYSSENLRDSAGKGLQHVCNWPTVGLPDGYYPLLAMENNAFGNNQNVTISHGAASIEEVIVPFVQIERA